MGRHASVRSAIYQLESYMAHLRRSDHQDATGRLIPMLVSSYLSPESRSICTDHNVAYLDLFGNAYLAFDNVYIERSVAADQSPKLALCGQYLPRRQPLSCGSSCAIQTGRGASPT